MIVGNGIDLIEIERVNSIYKKFQNSFVRKYFINDKIENLEARVLANNFAIKEAFSKSLGLILSASGIRGTSNFFYYKYNSILMVECL